MAKRIFILILPILLIFASNICHAATIHGIVYDFYLSPQKNAIIEINSLPKQTFVTKDGAYKFDIPIGEYTITATYKELDEVQAYIQEQISVQGEGYYVLDLILFPEFSEEQDLINESNIEVEDFLKTQYNYGIIMAIAGIILVIAVLIIYFLKKQKRQEQTNAGGGISEKDQDLEKIISIIKKHKRITQKELRKEMPYSEAKISLMITELEDKGVIKRIKKGRGNILVLK